MEVPTAADGVVPSAAAGSEGEAARGGLPRRSTDEEFQRRLLVHRGDRVSDLAPVRSTGRPGDADRKADPIFR